MVMPADHRTATPAPTQSSGIAAACVFLRACRPLPPHIIKGHLARPAEAERAPRWRRAGHLVMPAEHRTATPAPTQSSGIAAACVCDRACRPLPPHIIKGYLARPAEVERAPRWRRAGDLVMPAEHRTATSAQGTGTVLPAACTLARAARQRRRRSSPERAAGCAQGVAARRPGTQPGETPRARGAGRGSWSEIWPSPGASSGQNQILER